MSDTTSYDKSWDPDESWETEYSLEDIITKYANETTIRGADKASLDMPHFPENLRRAMEYIHKICSVRVKSESGSEYYRHPNYPEIYMGMFEAGFATVTGMPQIKRMRARRINLLMDDDHPRSTTVRGWSPVYLPSYVDNRRLHIRLLVVQVAKLRDLADDLQVSTGTIGIIVLAAALTMSGTWFEMDKRLTARYVANAEKCVQSFVEYTKERLYGPDGKQ